MDEEVGIIRAMINDYRASGGLECELLSDTVNGIHALACTKYARDGESSKRSQCMIIALHAVLTAGCEDNLDALIKDIPFVAEPVKKLYAKLDDFLIEAINNIRSVFAGSFIKLYFEIYTRAETEHNAYLIKHNSNMTALNFEHLEALISNKDNSLKNYNDVLRFCDYYRPDVEKKFRLKPFS